jgi:hypothetical protein
MPVNPLEIQQSLNSIYLSGWEYNRVLQDDPTAARNSALPAEVLWNGSAQFWLFEKVYCTKEALENERAGGERLGWVSGRIFSELAEGPDRVIEPLDWRTLPDVTKAALKSVRDKIVQDPKTDVRAWIRDGNVAMLETAKAQLLAPILQDKECLLGVSPNSLKNWQLPSTSLALGDQIRLRRFYSEIAAPLDRWNQGLRLCNRPGTGIPVSAREQEAIVRRTVEAPMIPDLLAGDNEFSGPRGFEPYLTKLEPYQDAYRPSDERLGEDWRQTKERLKRLRGVAEKHLWPQLHNDWLPQLLSEGDKFATQFRENIARALRASHFAELFNMQAPFLVAVGSGAAATVKLLSELAQIEISKEYTALIGALVALEASIWHARAAERYGSLALFYQAARRLER